MGDVKTLYTTLRVNMPELLLDSKQFCGFDRANLNRACHFLNINTYILDCALSDARNTGSLACLNWRSDFIEGGIRINMLEYQNHLMFIKDLKCLFKQWECGKCKRCFDHVGSLDQHVKICNGGEIKHVWKGGIYNPKKSIKQRLAEYGFDVTKHSFLFPYLAVYDTEASLPTAETQPVAKCIKTCNDLDGVCVERRLTFSSEHQ